MYWKRSNSNCSSNCLAPVVLQLPTATVSGVRRKFSWGVSCNGIWRSFVFGVRSLWRHNLTSYSCIQTNVLVKFVDMIGIFFYTRGRQPFPSGGPKTKSARYGGLYWFYTNSGPFAFYDVKTWEFMGFQPDLLLIFTVHSENPKHDVQYIYSTVRFLLSSSS